MLNFQVTAQFNLLVGYGLGYDASSDINDMIRAHNELNPWYKNELSTLSLSHGLFMGVRLGKGRVRGVMLFSTANQRTEAEGIPTGSSESFSRSLHLSRSTISGGLESNFERVNWGAMLDYNFFRVKGEQSILNDRYEILSDQFLSGQLYLMIEFRGSEYMGFALRPYVQFPFGDLGLDTVSDELEVDHGYRYNSVACGLTFVLVNGPQ